MPIFIVNTEAMKLLIEIVKDKLDGLYCPYNPRESLLGQLMLAVFNEETPDGLTLNMYDRDEMEQEVLTLSYHSDERAMKLLLLTDPE